MISVDDVGALCGVELCVPGLSLGCLRLDQSLSLMSIFLLFALYCSWLRCVFFNCLRRMFLLAFLEVDLNGVKVTSLSGDGEGSWSSSSSLDWYSG